MKKIFSLRVSIILITAFFVTSCPEDETGSIGPVDLSGGWLGVVEDNEGVQTLSMFLTQNWDTVASTPDSVFGTIYVEQDILSLAGVVQESDLEAVVNGECATDVELEIKREGVELKGTAKDRVDSNCSGNTIGLRFFKERPSEFSMVGTWTGTFSGDESGPILFDLGQYGNTVYGYIYPDYTSSDPDTISVYGYAYGDDLVLNGTEEDEDCNPTVLVMRVKEGSMSGVAKGGGGGIGNDCRFTANINVTGPIITKRKN